MPAAKFDVLIVGAGLAGTALALRLADDGCRVGLVTKKSTVESSSHWAQGGIAAALGAEDSPELHAEDTFKAGGGLCHRDTVELVAERGPESIRWLQERGVQFTRTAGGEDLHLTREGGHGQRRVAHVADATGEAVMDTLSAQARRHPGIQWLEGLLAIDLVTTAKLGAEPNRCLGVYALNSSGRRVKTLTARTVVLATGGASKVYLYTTNPDTSTGDGIAMAWRAGCRVANLEFVQFHPTCLYHPLAKSVLISEALRGEGGILVLPDGHRFMPAHDERAELAPRDVVARAIDSEMKRGGYDSVYLDISHRPAKEIREHFPNIAKRCESFGIDITREPIPVVPAAHYTCGGIVTDLEARTDILGLYAVGECSCTGLHGANRLASNSLLECLVFAEAAHRRILADLQALGDPELTAPTGMKAGSRIPTSWSSSRTTGKRCGASCGTTSASCAPTNDWSAPATALNCCRMKLHDFYGNFRVTSDLIELRNLALVAELTIRSALARHESRGLHFNRDYPDSFADEEAADTVLTPRLYG